MADTTCMDLVRAHHRDRYLSTLFAPESLQPHVFGLYAFDAEIARIPSLVSEPQIGEIRLQWWRDTIASIYQGEAVDHPVAQALAAAITQGRLPQQPLQNLIDARVIELYADPMPSLNDLEGYLGETRSAVLQMAAQVLAGGAATTIADAAGYAGVAQGIAELLEAKPKLPHKGLHLLPSGIDLLPHAQTRLQHYETASQSLPKNLRLAFLPVATVRARLEKLRRKGPGAGLSPLKAQWLIWRASLSG